MPNVRGSKTHQFCDVDNIWPAMLAYAERHNLKGGGSAVIRIAVQRLLADEDAPPAEGEDR